MTKLPVAVFVSGNGTNLQSIIDACESGKIDAEIKVVVCNRPGAYAMERARKHNIPVILEDHTKYPGRREHEMAVLERLKQFQPELIVLAGYMRLMTSDFISGFFNEKKKLPGIMNIHPALLPSFPGTSGYEDAFKYGVKISGVTVHFVDTGVDTGPIILQETFPRQNSDTLDKFRDRGLAVEHKILPRAINLYANDKLELRDRYVIVKETKKKTPVSK